MSFTRFMTKQTGISTLIIQNTISIKKEQPNDILNNLDASQGHFAE